jgi:hypothetical protein
MGGIGTGRQSTKVLFPIPEGAGCEIMANCRFVLDHILAGE